ncbi:MAG: hypothetical protein AAGB93_23900, partial [Planctomycetota bacterium]
RAIIQVKTRDLQSGGTGSFRPSAGEQFEVAFLDKKKAQYLYQEATGDYVFMSRNATSNCSPADGRNDPVPPDCRSRVLTWMIARQLPGVLWL